MKIKKRPNPLTIRLPDTIRQELKDRAVQERKTTNGLVCEAIKKYLGSFDRSAA